MLGRTMLSDQEVVQALDRAGMEIEQFISSIEIDKKVVVGLVKKVAQHPRADRLQLVHVMVGEQEYRIVCGAKNVRDGMKVALALPGSSLPSGDRIEAATLRGELSEGMLCSERELGIGTDHAGIMELPAEAEAGMSLCDLYPADTVIDLKTPANRFDVLSVVGLAREVAAMTNTSLALALPPELAVSPHGSEIAPGAVVSRYMLARVGTGHAATSPAWMKARLRAAGMRVVSPVVDITNYVMLEFGQPLHAFDAAKVKLPMTVRYARAGESIVTLDGVKRSLTAQDLIIADQTGPIALGGLMGGAATEVKADTREILLEAATFDAVDVRKMAVRHGLRTEASARFERGLPVQLPPLGIARTVQLLQELAGGELKSASELWTSKPRLERIELSADWLARRLGFGISHKEARAALEKLQIPVEGRGDSLVVPEVPWWRPDLKLPEDLAEEVVRVVGYDRVPATLPPWRPRQVRFDRMRSKRRQVRDLLYGAGLFEVMTYSFVSREQLEQLGYELDQHLKLKNPLSIEQAYLRSSLLPSHLAVVARNRKYGRELAFYELSKVFVQQAPGELPSEPLRLAITVLRPEASYVHAKGLLDTLAHELNVELTVRPGGPVTFAAGRSGEVLLAGQPIGLIGQLHPDQGRRMGVRGEIAYMEVDLDLLLTAARTRQFSGVDRFPTIQRDIAVIVPVTATWQAVVDALRDLVDVRVSFVGDYYADVPEGHKSLTLRLTLAHPDRTPTDGEAADAERKVLARLQHAFQARIRD